MDEHEQQKIFRAMERMLARVKFDAPTRESFRALLGSIPAIQTHSSLLHWTYRDDWGRETRMMQEVEEWE